MNSGSLCAAPLKSLLYLDLDTLWLGFFSLWQPHLQNAALESDQALDVRWSKDPSDAFLRACKRGQMGLAPVRQLLTGDLSPRRCPSNLCRSFKDKKTKPLLSFKSWPI